MSDLMQALDKLEATWGRVKNMDWTEQELADMQMQIDYEEMSDVDK